MHNKINIYLLFFASLIINTLSAQTFEVEYDPDIQTIQHYTEMGAAQWACSNLVEVKTNSDLIIEGYTSYEGKNVLKADLAKVWIPNSPENASITFQFLATESEDWTFLGTFHIFNGYRFDDFIWQDYSRIKKMSIYYNEQYWGDIELQDILNLQTFNIDISTKVGDEIRFEITEAYEGTLYKEFAISFFTPVCLP